MARYQQSLLHDLTLGTNHQQLRQVTRGTTCSLFTHKLFPGRRNYLWPS